MIGTAPDLKDAVNTIRDGLRVIIDILSQEQSLSIKASPKIGEHTLHNDVNSVVSGIINVLELDEFRPDSALKSSIKRIYDLFRADKNKPTTCITNRVEKLMTYKMSSSGPFIRYNFATILYAANKILDAQKARYIQLERNQNTVINKLKQLIVSVLGDDPEPVLYHGAHAQIDEFLAINKDKKDKSKNSAFNLKVRREVSNMVLIAVAVQQLHENIRTSSILRDLGENYGSEEFEVINRILFPNDTVTYRDVEAGEIHTDSLEPSSLTNHWFSSLVAMTIKQYSEYPEEDEKIRTEVMSIIETEYPILLRDIQDIAIEAEEAMERYFVTEALESYSSQTPPLKALGKHAKYDEKIELLRKVFSNFPYFINYERLPILEIDKLEETIGQKNIDITLDESALIAVPDARDMPISAIFYHIYKGVRIALIEETPQIRKRMERLLDIIGELGIIEREKFTTYDSNETFIEKNNNGADVILISGYVYKMGKEQTQHKEEIISQLTPKNKTGDTMLIMRDSSGGVVWLYPTLNRGKKSSIEVLAHSGGRENKVYNTSVVARVLLDTCEKGTSQIR